MLIKLTTSLIAHTSIADIAGGTYTHMAGVCVHAQCASSTVCMIDGTLVRVDAHTSIAYIAASTRARVRAVRIRARGTATITTMSVFSAFVDVCTVCVCVAVNTQRAHRCMRRSMYCIDTLVDTDTRLPAQPM